jgi:cytochrome c peroxidase
MNKLVLVLPVVSLLLSGCNNSSNTTPTPPQPKPSVQITACPSDSAEDKAYSPIDQMALLATVKAGKNQQAFLEAFEQGDLIFGTNFTLEQGGGANIGGTEKSHYTRIPRADLKNTGEWGDPNRAVRRPTGPNAQSCVSCHNQASEDGAGPTSANVHRDHRFSGNPELMIQRNTPHTFGAGALQRLAEEMTEELYDVKNEAAKKACASKTSVQQDLTAKGVNFGHITMSCASGIATIDAENSKIEGIDPDWIVRPYEWKKSVAFLRDFMRHAGQNEIGMQGVELVGKGVDEDNDGITNELSVGDMTAFTVYMAAQPRPTTKVELDDLGILTGDQHLKTAEREQIKHGDKLFQQIGCAACHKPELTLNNAIFQEPSEYDAYRDKKADFNQKDKVQVDLEAEGVLPEQPVKFDLAHDQPQNQLCIGKKKVNLGAFENKGGKTIVRLYGDLKRHWMGDKLAEAIDELKISDESSDGANMSLNAYNPVNAIAGVESYPNQPDRGKATFGTKELWGVACTGPWLHNGQATTLTEAIVLHGGEAAESSDHFKALSAKDQKDIIAFLGNQVLYLNTADSGKPADGLSSACEVEK